MAQQINLCTPILLTQKRYFSAQTLLQSLALFLVLGGVLCAYWVMSLNSASSGLKKTLDAQAPELANLQAAVAASKALAGSSEVALAQEVLVSRAELAQRQAVLDELHRGVFRDGRGHSARLQLVATSIPGQVWVTDVKGDEARLEVSGFTLEPAALNEWVAKLSESPLLEGQKLATVKVEKVKTEVAATQGMTPQTLAATQLALSVRRPLWMFTLVVATAVTPVGAAGGKT
ncbi:MAG: hypothetical protein RIS34_1637 [Pseudomonadota bacterium]|jgi:Tfp pilus assembly protein PilN